MFFAQFCDFMILILLAAAGVSFVTSYLQHDTDYVDSIIILAIGGGGQCYHRGGTGKAGQKKPLKP